MALRRALASGSIQSATYRSAKAFVFVTASSLRAAPRADGSCGRSDGVSIPRKVWNGGGGADTESSVTIATEPNAFSHELRRWRMSRRWSQLELAVRAGTTQRHVSFMEQGRSRPGRDMVLRLAESMELTLRERNELLLA